MAKAPKILMVAGELSGDYHASHLVNEIRQVRPDAELVGFGSRHMRAAGVRVLAETADWGGIGVFDNLLKIGKTSAGYRLFQKTLIDEKPDVFVPVDYRFFNLRAARFARAHGVPSVYYFAPVSWDLGRNRPIAPALFGQFGGRGAGEAAPRRPDEAIPARYRQVAEAVDFALVTFKFAVPFYTRTGMKFEYIGHPLAEILEKQQAAPLPPDLQGKKIVAILPGSREMEIRRHLPVLLDATRELRSGHPEHRFMFSLAAPELRSRFEALMTREDRAAFPVYDGDAADLLRASTLALVCSGTAVHQGMVLGTPMIAFYKVNPVLAEISRYFLFNLPFYAFPNVVAGREVIPELIQQRFTADRVTEAARKLLRDEEVRRNLRAQLLELADPERVPGGLRRAAEIICSFLPKDES